MKKKPKSRNIWTILGFVTLGFTALYMLAAILIQKTQDIIMPGHWFLLGASLFIGLMTTGSLKEGRFFGRFYDCTKAKTPISFWSQAICGYLFAGVLAAIFTYQLLK